MDDFFTSSEFVGIGALGAPEMSKLKRQTEVCRTELMQNTEELKTRVHDFWQANPCGIKFSDLEIGTREFFEAVERHRYQTEWHIPQVVDFSRWRDSDVTNRWRGKSMAHSRTGARGVRAVTSWLHPVDGNGE